MATTLTHSNYFTITQNEVRSHVEYGEVKTFIINLFGKYRGFSISQYLLDRFVKKLANTFTSLSLELEGLHTRMLNQDIAIDNPQEDYSIIKDIIKSLTKADELFSKINYFDNVGIKKEIKNSLNTCYLIEVELRTLVYKDKKKSFVKDELFEALAIKSNESLILSHNNATTKRSS